MSLFDPIDALFGVNGEDPGARFNEAGLTAINGVNPPSADDLKVQLQKAVYAGDITPEQAQTYLANPSLMNSVDGSPQGKAAQLQALSQLQGISTQGGLTPTDQAQLAEIESRNASAARGSREAIMQNARERGMGGSGTALLDEMVNGQESATRANQEGLGVAAQAQNRALQAIQASGQLGNQIETQNFGEGSAKAAAQDAINKFNTTNQNTTEAANVAAKNAALARNAETKQAVSDTNTGIGNTNALTNANAKQTAFSDQMAKAGGVAGAYGNLAAGKSAAENSKRAFEGGLLNTAGNIGAGYMISDKTKKKDVADVPANDLEEFMASLDPKSFKYKDPNQPGASGGDNVGVMAQDVEKTPIGKTAVTDTPDGKAIDIKKLMGVVLAAIAELHQNQEKGGANA